MAKPETPSNVLTLRVPRDLDRRLAREARRRRVTRGAMARMILAHGLEHGLRETPATDPLAEAHRQSVLASTRKSEREALAFVIDAADLEGWK